ncbi:hypothetical protein LINGRAHAP2_LOCUS31461, partial [Linum grandiflorum]
PKPKTYQIKAQSQPTTKISQNPNHKTKCRLQKQTHEAAGRNRYRISEEHRLRTRAMNHPQSTSTPSRKPDPIPQERSPPQQVKNIEKKKPNIKT